MPATTQKKLQGFKKAVHFLSLFGSLGTLFCCALPVLLVSLGLGFVFAGLSALFPQITILSEHKNLIFILAGLLLAASFFSMEKSKTLECPIDDKGSVCKSVKPKVFWIFILSCSIYILGFLFAYLIPWMTADA